MLLLLSKRGESISRRADLASALLAGAMCLDVRLLESLMLRGYINL